jgi:hypothetical protein
MSPPSNPIRKAAAWVFLAGIAMLAVFHLCLIAGAPWGHLTMGGRWEGALPLAGRAISALSVLILSWLGFVVAGAAGLRLSLPPTWAKGAVLVYFALAILAHIVTPSAPERALWLPVILAMSVALGLVFFAKR